MAAAISNEFQLIVPKTPESVQVKLGSDFTVLCHLSPEISAVDMEIRWFKGTDCVCIYKNRQMIEGKGYGGRVNLFTKELQERGDVSLQLKNFKGTDAGLYLCQVTSESTTVKMTVQVKPELVVNNVEEFHQKLFQAFRDQCKKLEQTELKVIDLEKIIESKNHELHAKNRKLEINDKTLIEMEEQLKKLQTKLTNTTNQQTTTSRAEDSSNSATSNPVNSVQTAPSTTEDASNSDTSNPVNSVQTPPSTTEDSSNSATSNPVNSMQTAPSTTEDASNSDTSNPVNSVQTPPSTTEDASNSDTSNPVNSVQTPPSTTEDSSNSATSNPVNSMQTAPSTTEDSSNSATSNPVNSVQTPPSTTEDSSNSATSNPVNSVQTPPSTRGLRLFSILTGKTNNFHMKFTDTLIDRFQDLKEVPTVDHSNIVLVFCPIVSRAGTDIRAALKTFTDSTASKLNVLVLLHPTFDQAKTVRDSSRYVNRTDILTVDCLFYEDTGLLECQMNRDAVYKVVNWLIEEGKKRGLNVSLRQRDKSSGILPSLTSWFQRR
ncbi:uncharacterized protein [Paramisgurnus dabryanus]|uniref:uncharacterized protein n=1 Tax=Paramisgurnus dabryanus TaxID=90735 RepID=UPI003CCF3734